MSPAEVKNNKFDRARAVLRQNGLSAAIAKAHQRVSTNLHQYLDRFWAKIGVKFCGTGFHRWFYYTFFTDSFGTPPRIEWLGVGCSKCPLDLWVYQEILSELKPEVIIETGTDRGGSALFFASLCDLLGRGEVITIDVQSSSAAVTHPRIQKIVGDSVASATIEQVTKMVGRRSAFVVLDSDHRRDHVLRELERYSVFVPVGGYLVVEDTDINGHPVMPGWGPGPMEAVDAFLKTRTDFIIDASKEKFLMTCHPRGFLKRVA